MPASSSRLPYRDSMSDLKPVVRNRGKTRSKSREAIAIDVFSGAGGLTRGLLDAGIKVVAGYDIDGDCEFPYEHNNPGVEFFQKSVAELTGKTLAKHYPAGCCRILVGCAPCAPFSKYTQAVDKKTHKKWNLLREFGRLVKELKPDIVSMENVPDLRRHSVFDEFVEVLSTEGFHFTREKEKQVVYCPDYGLPQHRSRLVLIASRFGPIDVIEPTHEAKDYLKVRDAIGSLPKLGAGDICKSDLLHRTSKLSRKNLERIQYSKPGGSWRTWPSRLVAPCHKRKTGKGYPAVYGRMEWNALAPTITTQFFGFGSGRFGHPEQDRAISLREGAILQSFPKGYEFVEPKANYCIKTIGRLIGNAVPVRLAEVIGESIKRHLAIYGCE
jgi:DNA (cytosine-5)-methyltransferase 1